MITGKKTAHFELTILDQTDWGLLIELIENGEHI